MPADIGYGPSRAASGPDIATTASPQGAPTATAANWQQHLSAYLDQVDEWVTKVRATVFGGAQQRSVASEAVNAVNQMSPFLRFMQQGGFLGGPQGPGPIGPGALGAPFAGPAIAPLGPPPGIGGPPLGPPPGVPIGGGIGPSPFAGPAPGPGLGIGGPPLGGYPPGPIPPGLLGF